MSQTFLPNFGWYDLFDVRPGDKLYRSHLPLHTTNMEGVKMSVAEKRQLSYRLQAKNEIFVGMSQNPP